MKVLKVVFEETLKFLVKKKPSLSIVSTMDGYFQMIFSKFHVYADGKHNCSINMIHNHVAHLLPDQKDNYNDLPIIREIYKSETDSLVWFPQTKPSDQTNPNQRTFEPTTVYLDLSVDELTNMIFFSDWSQVTVKKEENIALQRALSQLKGALKNFEPTEVSTEKLNVIKEIRQSVFQKLEKYNIFSLSFRISVEYLFSNLSDSTKKGKGVRSGNKLEALINGSFVKASASGGPSGISLDNFLLKFFSELGLEKPTHLSWDPESLLLLSSIKDQLVPYVIAVNYQMTPHFRAIDGVYTGTLPDVVNCLELDGACIPDWVEELERQSPAARKGKEKSQRDVTTLNLAKNTLKLSKDANCQLFITLEMKNYDTNIGASVVKSVLGKAAKNGRQVAQKWPQSSEHRIHHVHLFCVSSLAAIEDWESIHCQFGHVIKLFQLTFIEGENKIGLKNLFLFPDPKSVNIEIPSATDVFPHSTVIIISLKDLFGYGFEADYNVESNSQATSPETSVSTTNPPSSPSIEQPHAPVAKKTKLTAKESHKRGSAEQTGQHKCSTCGLYGHNKRSCREPQ
jgi:hypothetical protein